MKNKATARTVRTATIALVKERLLMAKAKPPVPDVLGTNSGAAMTSNTRPKIKTSRPRAATETDFEIVCLAMVEYGLVQIEPVELSIILRI